MIKATLRLDIVDIQEDPVVLSNRRPAKGIKCQSTEN